jgi:hypothetical protein
LLIGMPLLMPCGLHVGASLLVGVQGFYKHELPFVELMPQCWHLDRTTVRC